MLSLAAALTVALAQRSQTRPFQADGTEVEVRHYPPQGDGPHPLLLIVPPGLQDHGDAGDVLRDFRDTVADGWLVASPIAPGTYFHRGAERLLAPLVDAMAEAYPVGDVHLIGVSTGAAGAVKAALLAPDRYASLTLFPGAPEESDAGSLAGLGDLPVYVYVGAADPDRADVEAGVEAFRAAGVTAQLTVVEGSGHRLPGELGSALTERLASPASPASSAP
ncbi:MAG: alpha/beta hydrolase [Trueperaceae bacterium]|nr:alpha/beta hydrolase [Trueperaceae bacterium]